MKALAGQAATVLARVGLLDALENADRATNRVNILAYHRIDELDAEPNLDPGLLSATPRDFRAQMEIISTHYTAISLDQLVTAHLEGSPLPPRSVLLTFDDGYADFAKNAWPILQSLDLPAILFVSTAFPDTPGPGFWWDRLFAAVQNTREEALEVDGLGLIDFSGPEQRRQAHRLLRSHTKTLSHPQAMKWIDDLVGRLAELPSLHRVLGWDALRRLASEGLSVCSHGRSHALLTRLSPSELDEDLVESKARIEAELGDFTPPPVIAYPANACGPAVLEAVERSGYQIAFGGRRGTAQLPLAEPLNLMRIPVHRYGTALFRAQLRPSVSRLGRMFIDRSA